MNAAVVRDGQPVQAVWRGRVDHDEAGDTRRLFNVVRGDVRREPGAPVLIGFCCDAGVLRNQGRPGAAAGPQEIRRALASLPEAQRQTLEVAFFEGLSYPEIAARENVPLGTIKSRAARALAALREALVKEGVSIESLVKGG